MLFNSVQAMTCAPNLIGLAGRPVRFGKTTLPYELKNWANWFSHTGLPVLVTYDLGAGTETFQGTVEFAEFEAKTTTNTAVTVITTVPALIGGQIVNQSLPSTQMVPLTTTARVKILKVTASDGQVKEIPIGDVSQMSLADSTVMVAAQKLSLGLFISTLLDEKAIGGKPFLTQLPADKSYLSYAVGYQKSGQEFRALLLSKNSLSPKVDFLVFASEDDHEVFENKSMGDAIYAKYFTKIR